MGARPSSFKRSGGYLNNVDATIVGYQFVASDAVEIKKGNRKGEMFTPLSLVPEFQEDGAEDTKTQRLLIGDATNYGEISDDGLTLMTPDGQCFPASSEAGIFLASLCQGVFSEDRFSDSTDEINLEPMIGTRLKLVQEVNAQKTKNQGQQTGKDGKLYDRKDLKVSEVYSVTPLKGKTQGVKTGKGKAQVEAVDVNAIADDVTAAVVEKKGGTLNRNRLSAELQVMKGKYPKANGEWKDIAALVMTPAYLIDADARGIINYDEKKQILSSAS